MHAVHSPNHNRAVRELASAISALLPSLPPSANVTIPATEDDFGGRVTLASSPDTIEIAWHIDAPLPAGPLDGSGAIFGDQIFNSEPLCEETLSRRATIRRADGVIVAWSETSNAPRNSAGASVQGFLSYWYDLCLHKSSNSPGDSSHQLTANHYMRMLRALEAITHSSSRSK